MVPNTEDKYFLTSQGKSLVIPGLYHWYYSSDTDDGLFLVTQYNLKTLVL